MPVRCPVGALPAAHRVMCLRAAKAMARGHIVEYRFASRGSKKCAYCTEQKGSCNPIPIYVGEEFTVLLQKLEAYQELSDGDDEQAAGLAEVSEAARSLSLCVQVTRAQEKDLGAPELLTASHHLLGQILEQVSVLDSRVATLETRVERGGGGCGESQKKKRRKETVVGVESESDLSDSGAEVVRGRGGD